MSVRLLVVGADGFDPVMGSYFLEKGLLPTIGSILKDGGQFGPLASRLGEQEVPHTGPAWISLYTGQTERDHGVTFGGWLKGAVSFESHYDESIFARLVENDYRVGSAFMPITYPAAIDTDNGSWMISGFPSAGDHTRSVAPDEMISLLPDDYESLQARSLLGDDDEEPAPISEWVAAETRKRDEVLPAFVDESPPDVLFYGSQICDVAGHVEQPVPPFVDGGLRRVADRVNDALGTSVHPPRIATLVWNRGVRDAYRAVDDTLSTLIDRYDPDEIMMVSDHGFQRDGSDHALLGSSLVSEGLSRPEYITEVSDVIAESQSIRIDDSSSGESSKERPESTLSDEEKAEIEDHLDALGYKD